MKIFAARVLCEYGILLCLHLEVLATTVPLQLFLLPLYPLKYLLPQCCFNMVSDCSYKPTSASQVYIYIHVSMTFITVSMYLEVTGATVPCQLIFFCSSTLSHCYHSHVSIRLITVPMQSQIIADTVRFKKVS